MLTVGFSQILSYSNCLVELIKSIV